MIPANDMIGATPVGIGLARSAQDLSAIAHPSCAASVWQRRPTAEFTNWINGLSPDLLPKARIVLRPERVRETLEQICDIAKTPKGPERDMLVADAAALAETFAGVMNAPYLRLRLDVVTTNACRRFHIDAVTARLVCTYRGTGTQYGMSNDGAEPAEVFTVPTGAPIVLRGTLWPEQPASGLLHRSPPIEGTGETRLVLVLDPIADLENDPFSDPIIRH